MMISKKTKYALKALEHLTRHSGEGPILISELAEAETIPKKFLEAILLSLRKGGILQSRIGKGGGYSLALDSKRITIGSVVRILEGDIAPVQCLSDTSYTRCEECADESSCGTRLVMADVKKAMATVLDSVTLADMLERSENEKRKNAKVIDFAI
jgi:Rrf2 family protein